MKAGSAHVVIIGAGALGCAIALQLSMAGYRVTLIDSGEVSSQASINNAGNLNPLLMTPPSLLPLALESFRLHIELPAVLSSLGVIPHAIQPVRRLLLAFTEEEATSFPAIAQSFEKQSGFSATQLNSQELKRQEPALATDLHSALLLEGNLAVDGEDLLRALRQAAQKIGTTTLYGVVSGLETTGHQVRNVQLGEHNISCDAVVLATGAYIADTKEWLNLSLPVVPVKGQMLRMKLAGYNQSFDMTCGDISLYKRRDNEIWIGMTQEHVGLDTTPTTEAREFLLQEATRFFPQMAHAGLLAHTAAIRPTTASGLPVVAKAPDWENVYIANGGGMKGILLCTGMAQIVHDLISIGSSKFISGVYSV